jgi:hypothetical protein
MHSHVCSFLPSVCDPFRASGIATQKNRDAEQDDSSASWLSPGDPMGCPSHPRGWFSIVDYLVVEIARMTIKDIDCGVNHNPPWQLSGKDLQYHTTNCFRWQDCHNLPVPRLPSGHNFSFKKSSPNEANWFIIG